MGIFDSIKKSVFGVSYANKLMKSINAPVFVKDFNRENEEIAQLYSRLNNTKDEAAKKKIENEIYLKKFVHDGLSKVYFELKNSPVPYYGLYNIRLEQGVLLLILIFNSYKSILLYCKIQKPSRKYWDW